MTRKKVCPKCGSENIVPIVYGYPSKDMMKKHELGQAKLGGCTVLEDNHDCYCKQCNYEWQGSSIELEENKYTEIINIIDRAIKETWTYDISKDYDRSFIL